MTMKKMMTAVGVLGLSFAVFAGAEDPIMMFSTPGVDKYADGATVLDGECYALCYVTDAANFAVKADGSAIGGEVVLVAPVAKGGKCPEIMYQVPAAKADALTGGSWGVYLLDTRVQAADGYKVAQKDAEGNWIVNGFTAVAEGAQASGNGISSASAFAGKTVTGGAQIAANVAVVDSPVISAIKVEGAKVVVKVSGMSPVVDYKVFTAPAPQGFSTKIDADADGDTFTFDKPADGQFFKVIGTRKVQ